MGDYNSVRVGVCAELPCDPTMTALGRHGGRSFLSLWICGCERKSPLQQVAMGEDEGDGSEGLEVGSKRMSAPMARQTEDFPVWTRSLRR